jgi:hypothetical protein
VSEDGSHGGNNLAVVLSPLPPALCLLPLAITPLATAIVRQPDLIRLHGMLWQSSKIGLAFWLIRFPT